ncbi:2107_t:CDS:1, partial [Gigaspora margarita]
IKAKAQTQTPKVHSINLKMELNLTGLSRNFVQMRSFVTVIELSPNYYSIWWQCTHSFVATVE